MTNWTDEENTILFNLLKIYGWSKWDNIAKSGVLKGRTKNQIYYRAKELKKKYGQGLVDYINDQHKAHHRMLIKARDVNNRHNWNPSCFWSLPLASNELLHYGDQDVHIQELFLSPVPVNDGGVGLLPQEAPSHGPIDDLNDFLNEGSSS
eukprot:scaffold2077_cov96-Skeletonema_menzelii.AAC.2